MQFRCYEFQTMGGVSPRGSRKTGRRTKYAPRTPGKGRKERALAGAPFGARLQGTASFLQNLPVFLGSSVLTLARQFDLSPVRHKADPDPFILRCLRRGGNKSRCLHGFAYAGEG